MKSEYANSSLSLLRRGGPAKQIKLDVKPRIDVPVDGEVLVADLPRGEFLLQRLCLRGRAVLVGTTDVQRVPVAQAAVPVTASTHLQANMISTQFK